MREILFRGKTTLKEKGEFNNIWVEGDLVTSRGKTYIHPKANAFRVDGELTKIVVMHEVIPETVGQFTGLLDKNGTKIFEGDIVSIAELSAVKIVGCYVVKYNLEQARYGIYTEQGLEQAGFNLNTMSNYNVVGNIYDNPELLE